MMKGIADVKRSLKEISRPIMGGMDLDVLVFDSLSDNELDLLKELSGLCKSGFSAEEIEDMMGSESYELAIAVAQKVEETVKLLTAPPLKKMVPRPKYRKRLVDDLGANLMCAPTINKNRIIDHYDDVDEESDIDDLEIA